MAPRAKSTIPREICKRKPTSSPAPKSSAAPRLSSRFTGRATRFSSNSLMSFSCPPHLRREPDADQWSQLHNYEKQDHYHHHHGYESVPAHTSSPPSRPPAGRFGSPDNRCVPAFRPSGPQG